jgi:hypothetical protein
MAAYLFFMANGSRDALNFSDPSGRADNENEESEKNEHEDQPKQQQPQQSNQSRTEDGNKPRCDDCTEEIVLVGKRPPPPPSASPPVFFGDRFAQFAQVYNQALNYNVKTTHEFLKQHTIGAIPLEHVITGLIAADAAQKAVGVASIGEGLAALQGLLLAGGATEVEIAGRPVHHPPLQERALESAVPGLFWGGVSP